MDLIGLWTIQPDGPKRLQPTSISFERDLENWIASDPAVLERGLVIVGRQLRLEAGPLDLLALDPQGRWVIIEVKRERLRREVVSQAIDYASCLDCVDAARLREQCDAYLRSVGSGTSLDRLLAERGQSLDDDAETKEILIYLVGLGQDPGLMRMVGYLSNRFDVSIQVVTFTAFQDDAGRQFLARRVHETTPDTPSGSATRTPSDAPGTEQLLAKADANGVGPIVRTLHTAAVECGLYAKCCQKSFMIAPPTNKTICLMFLPVDRPSHIRNGQLKVWVGPSQFDTYMGIREEDAARHLGFDGYRFLDLDAARTLADGLRRLLAGNHR